MTIAVTETWNHVQAFHRKRTFRLSKTAWKIIGRMSRRQKEGPVLTRVFTRFASAFGVAIPDIQRFVLGKVSVDTFAADFRRALIAYHMEELSRK